jgi:hypothetical protein
MKESFSGEDYNDNRELIYIKKYKDYVRGDKNMALLNKLSYIDYSQFKIIDKKYSIEVIPTSDFIEITGLDKLIFFISEPYNLIDIETFLPENLKGYGIMFNIYYLLTKHFGFISSNRYSSEDAKNLWYSYMKRENLYCVTSDFFSYAIDYNISDIQLKNIYDQIENRKDYTKFILCKDFINKLKTLSN